MLNSLLTEWSWLRIARLVLGGLALFQGLAEGQNFLTVIGSVLLFQGVFNVKCGPCENGSCENPVSQQSDQETQSEEEFEIVTPTPEKVK